MQKAQELQAILQILADGNSRKLNPRYDDIFGASIGTFDWILREPAKLFAVEHGTKFTFVDWLRDGEGIFHVLGKPGAGKSTLMKLIWDHDITKKMLKEWAGDSQLLCMKYFFWKSESSQSGLRGLKSFLLSSMLEQAPDLMDALIPGPKGDGVTYEQLSQAFDLFLKSPQALEGYRVFLLIDGLDEFDEERNAEDHHDLVRLIQVWASQSEGKVKICVSSREYEAFATVTHHQKIRLQNLSKEDRKAYVTERLTSHPRFPQLEASCEKAAEKLHEDHWKSHTCNPDCLIRHIVEVSDGVFLWVRLVMVQVRKCLSADCSLRKIWRHVDSQPKPLTDFIKHMLDSILPLYQREACILLSIVHRHQSTNREIYVSPQGATYLCDRLDRVDATLLSQQPDHGGLGLTLQEADWRSLTAEDITARFNGLLEVSDQTEWFYELEIPTLTFTHRSIIEVLRNSIDAKLVEHGITQVELGHWLCQIALGEFISLFKPLKDRVDLSIGFVYLETRLADFFCFLRDQSLFEEPSVIQQLDRVEDICLTLRFGRPQPSKQNWQRFYFWARRGNFGRYYLSIMVLAISHKYAGALPWILKRLENIPKRGYLVSILLWTCIEERYKSSELEQISISVIQTALLERGFIGVDLLDGEQKAHVSKHGCHTAESWVIYVAFLLTTETQSDSDWAITELWLDRGANPRICLANDGVRLGMGLDSFVYVSVKINGKWFQSPESVRVYGKVDMQDLPVTLRGFIARSDAPNKERLLELVDRNTDMIEAEEAADAAAGVRSS